MGMFLKIDDYKKNSDFSKLRNLFVKDFGKS